MNTRIFMPHEIFLITYYEKYSFFRCFFYRDRSLSIQTRNFQDSKDIAGDVFAKILISMSPENFSPQYQSGYQLNRGKIDNDRNEMGLKWDRNDRSSRSQNLGFSTFRNLTKKIRKRF